jgi:hypothetical protein
MRLATKLAGGFAALATVGGIVHGVAFAGTSAPVTTAALPALVYVSASSPLDSTVYKSVKVDCPAGLRVIGLSYNLPGAPGSVVLDDFIPSSTSVTVGAGEVVGPGEPSDGTTERWSVVATAVCTQPLPGLQIVSASTGPEQGTPFAEVVARCPFSQSMLGIGASLSQGFGQISISQLQVNGGAYAMAVPDEDGFSGTWSLTSYAICADLSASIDEHEFVATTGNDSPTAMSAETVCTFPRRAISVGWIISPGSQVYATGAYFTFNNTAARLDAHEDANGYNGRWQGDIIAFCAM